MNFFNRIPPVTRALIVVNVLIWAVCAILPGCDRVLENVCGLHYFSSPLFNPAQVFTYMFLHGGFMHLLFNMFTLYFFGSIIEPVLTSRRYLFYYIMCGLGAALIQEGVFAWQISAQEHHLMTAYGLTADDLQEIISQGAIAVRKGMTFTNPDLAHLNALYNGVTVGASGAIFGILIAVAVLFPNLPMYIMFIPVPIKAKWAVIGFAAIELFLGIGGMASSVAHFAHLGGMLVGWVIILIWQKKGVIHGRYF